MSLLFLGAPGHRILSQDLDGMRREFAGTEIETSRSVLRTYQSRKLAVEADAIAASRLRVGFLSSRPRLVSASVFHVINMLKRDMVARAAVDMIDGDQGMVALSERDGVIGLADPSTTKPVQLWTTWPSEA